MAKKRVYELAKERGVSSKELLSALQKAGVDVKAAASSVDEAEVAKLLSDPAKDGAADSKRGSDAKPAAEQPRTAVKTDSPGPKPGDSDGGSPSSTAARDAASPASRPKHVTQGDRAPGALSRRRRVVIDSQASRRQAPPPPPQQRRRRSRGRGAPPPEPQESTAPTAVAEPAAIKIPSGATVRDVAEHLGTQVSEVIKKLMQHGEMASITQTLSDEAIGVLADELNKRVEIVHAAEEEVAEQEIEDAEEDLVPRPPVVTIM